MNVASATVLGHEEVYEGGHLTWFRAPELTAAAPGQFAMVHCSNEATDPYFARAFSYHRVEDERFALLYTLVGKGTDWLAHRREGDAVRMYGPLGKGFRLPGAPGNLLLVGGGVGVAPLVDLAGRAVSEGHRVVAFMGARTATQLLPAAAWPEEVEYLVATEDGTAGASGFVTRNLGEYQEWASRIYACGPNPMFADLAEVLRPNNRRQRPEILMEENMPCGWGMCYGCAIFTRHGVKLCCKDGPRFNLFDVY